MYACGALGAWHRVRNADSLTVVMFHRTLREDDPRHASCDPDYTLGAGLFADSLRFFRRHYNVVSLADVRAAHRGERPLPPRAMLLTFDDGWLDNVDYALPALREQGLPAVMFVAANAVGARQPFYQERIIGAFRRGTLSIERLAAATGVPAKGAGIDEVRHQIDVLEHLAPEQREALLTPLAPMLDDGLRHMVDVADLHALRAGGVELGLHGKRHIHITRAADPDDELSGAREALARTLGLGPEDADAACGTMSFPHGAFDEALAARGREAGYELLFTSVPVLNQVGTGPAWLLGRTGYETATVADAQGRFQPDRMAWYLFRRPIRRLA